MKIHPARTTFILFLVFAFSISLDAYLDCGRIRLTRKNGFGCICHGDFASPNVAVQIFGPDSLAAGTSAQFTIAVFGGPDSSAGVNVAVSRGVIDTVDSTLCKIEDELTYAFPHPRPVDGAITWNFNYTAPLQTGQDTIWSVGNSVNLSGTPEGDEWNFGENFYVNVFPATSVSDERQAKSFSLYLKSYPNPANPNAVFSFFVPYSSFVNLSIFNYEGKAVSNLVNEYKEEGVHQITWSAGNLASSIYFARLSINNDELSAVKKLILVK
ncbi:MAG: T9SS type A sorting domain-containing protein [Ignavibacteriales bacterium]|nr:T9SS type A sorting domain-containing protein [Ignavibacteriales bacterium]